VQEPLVFPIHMKRVFSVDVLQCERCGGRMKILAAIHPPDTTGKILECLGLNGPSDRPHPSDHFALVCDLLLERDRAENVAAQLIKTDTADLIGVFANH